MSDFQHKEGSGSLFKNELKDKENQPDYRGDCLLNGKVMEIAAWIKEGKKGKFMSLSIKPKGDRPGGTKERAPAVDDGSIPF